MGPQKVEASHSGDLVLQLLEAASCGWAGWVLALAEDELAQLAGWEAVVRAGADAVASASLPFLHVAVAADAFSSFGTHAMTHI